MKRKYKIDKGLISSWQSFQFQFNFSQSLQVGFKFKFLSPTTSLISKLAKINHNNKQMIGLRLLKCGVLYLLIKHCDNSVSK